MSQELKPLTVTLTLPADAIAWLEALAENDETGMTTPADIVTGIVWREYAHQMREPPELGPNVVSAEEVGRRRLVRLGFPDGEIPF